MESTSPTELDSSHSTIPMFVKLFFVSTIGTFVKDGVNLRASCGVFVNRGGSHWGRIADPKVRDACMESTFQTELVGCHTIDPTVRSHLLVVGIA